MTPIKIMALIVALFSAVKLVVVLINPKFWIDNVGKKFWARPVLTSSISIVIAVVALMFLLQELTIVQIFAVMLFLICLMIIGFAPYSKDMMALMAEKFSKDKDFLKKGWLAITVWIILVIWVFLTLFT